MPHKKILIYFTKKEVASDPYAHLPEQRDIYWSIFREGASRGFDMYLGIRQTIHHGGMRFENALFFTGTRFELKNELITFDALYDRSIRKEFPTPDIDDKTLNSLAFKKIATNKDLTYELIGEYMPKTFSITSPEEFSEAIARFELEEMAVFKPVDNFGGKGVVITQTKNLTPDLFVPGKRFVLQKFVDTQKGIPGMAAGRHDLRVIVIHGEPVVAQVREPRSSKEFLANVSQGGTSTEFPYGACPAAVQSIVKKVHTFIDQRFSCPMYSIDFGIDSDGTPYIFEINDQIGFRGAITGERRDRFCKNLIDSLEVRATL